MEISDTEKNRLLKTEKDLENVYKQLSDLEEQWAEKYDKFYKDLDDADEEEAIDKLEKATERLEGANVKEKPIVKRRRILPDGAIEITELQGNKVISRYKKRPPH